MSESPVIYVDLIEEQPKTFDEYCNLYPGATVGWLNTRWRAYQDKFQPWRVVVKSGDNRKALFRSTERYFNRADAIHAAELAFADRSNVYLREAEQGDRVLRMAVPL